jgi:hypothetical protein
MRRILALSISLLTFTGCAQTSAFDLLADGSCNSRENQLVQNHIEGQISALTQQDWEGAYSFASPGFQEAVDVDQFEFIIGTQYQMLIDNQGVEYGGCEIRDKEILQDVSVTSKNEIFELIYTLSYEDETLGIESASINISTEKYNT